ncbi:MAG: LacI family DNA-binding transcriptional regulator [Planctomycetota bacterium]
MPSIREVAKTAGVSIATVSRVMNGTDTVAIDLREKVLKAVDACDYSPKVGRRSLDSIALIYVGPFTVGSPYDSACLEGMVDGMRASNLDLTIVDLSRDRGSGETLRQFFARKGIRGGVLRCTAAERRLAVDMAAEGLPLVVLGDHFDCDQLSFAYAGSKSASRDAVEHLVSLGHKRVAFAACERDDGDHVDRLVAYREVLREHGLLDESLVCRVPPHRFDGAQLLRNLLGMPHRPTALFVADPLVAVGAMNEAHRMGVRVPEDLSIVGFDDNDLRHTVYPRMSAVCQDAKLVGKAAWELVLRRCDERPGDAVTRLPPQEAWLEVCNSTGPAPTNPDRVLPTGARLSGARRPRGSM